MKQILIGIGLAGWVFGLGLLSEPSASHAAEPPRVLFTRMIAHWESYGDQVVLPPGLPAWRRALLTDPQTSGGLLVACKAERAESICAMIETAGYPRASIVGTVTDGEPAIRIV